MHASQPVADQSLATGDDAHAPVSGRFRLAIIAVSVVSFAATTAAAAYLGYLAMFTGFFAYDDEGALLLTLRAFVSGQALYDQISIQYGPFYFETMGALGALGVPFDHDSGRFITLAVWLAIALLSGVAVFAFTRNLALGLATQLITFATAATLTNEPMHPGGLVMLLVVGIAAVALVGAGRWSGRWPFVVIGALTAAAILTKVNVGGLAAIAIGFACVLMIPALTRNWPVRLLVAAVFVMVPFVLMKVDLGQAWAQRYSVHVAICALALVVVTSAISGGKLRLSAVGWLFVGGAAVSVAVVLVALLRGSTPSGLVHGMLLNPLQQTLAFELPLLLPGSTLVWDGVGLGGALLWVLYRSLTRRPELAIEGGIRVLVGLFIWLTLLGGIHIPGLFQLVSLNNRLVLPVALAWVVAAPRATSVGFLQPDFARVLVPALAVLESLEAYPVAGSDQAFAALMLVPVGAICIHDGVVQLSELGLTRVYRQIATAVVFAAIAVSWFPADLQQSRAAYDSAVSLGLPGATRVHVPADQAAILRQVTQALRANCDTFISLPGVDSFYVFAQLPPPTGPIRLPWLTSNVAKQQAIVALVDPIGRLCVIDNQDLVNFWLQGRPEPVGPLVTYVQNGFVPAESIGKYSLLVRR